MCSLIIIIIQIWQTKGMLKRSEYPNLSVYKTRVNLVKICAKLLFKYETPIQINYCKKDFHKLCHWPLSNFGRGIHLKIKRKCKCY